LIRVIVIITAIRIIIIEIKEVIKVNVITKRNSMGVNKDRIIIESNVIITAETLNYFEQKKFEVNHIFKND
jgi:hypothetical protein